MKLFPKFFLAFFVTNLVLVILVLLALGWNLTYGFNQFVSELDQRNLNTFKQRLLSSYRAHGSWQHLIDDHQAWRRLVDTARPASRGEHRPRRGEHRPPPHGEHRPPPRGEHRPPPRGEHRPPPRGEHRPPPRGEHRPPPRGEHRPPPRREHRPPPRGAPRLARDNPPPPGVFDSDRLQTGRRLSLYDADKGVIVGRANLAEHPQIEALILNGETIGWLGLVPARQQADNPANEFLRQQYEMIYLVAGTVLLLALLMAWLVARHLIAPIRQLKAGTDKLRRGHYEHRIDTRSRDELGQLSEDVNALAENLASNQQHRYQWVSDTSHELRTPLTVMKSHLIAIQDGIFQADKPRIEMFIGEIEKLSRIVDDLYQLSSADLGVLTYNKTPVEPVRLLAHVLDHYESQLSERALSVSRQFEQQLGCVVVADKDRLLQLFTNLLENSCRYTDEGGQLVIRAESTPQRLTIRIEDSAPAVPPAELDRLFDRFYRIEKSRSRDHGGSGLGLALCQQIVLAHGGDIKACGSPLGGLAIEVVLPLTE